jgi:hypothetical protein
MTKRAFQIRQDRIEAGRCPRCNRPVQSWPLQRPDNCGNKYNTVCLRHWHDIRTAEARLKVNK